MEKLSIAMRLPMVKAVDGSSKSNVCDSMFAANRMQAEAALSLQSGHPASRIFLL